MNVEWIPTLYGTNISQWAEWNSGTLTCFDLIMKYVGRAYNSGFQDGILFGIVIGILLSIAYIKIHKRKKDVNVLEDETK